MHTDGAGTRDISKLPDLGQFIAVMKIAENARDRTSLLGIMHAVSYASQGQHAYMCIRIDICMHVCEGDSLLGMMHAVGYTSQGQHTHIHAYTHTHACMQWWEFSMQSVIHLKVSMHTCVYA